MFGARVYVGWTVHALVSLRGIGISMGDASTPTVAEFREEFTKKYLGPESEKASKFDPRDVARFSKDDLFALSFLNWKKNVVKDAVEMVATVFEWRMQNKICDLSVESIGEEFFKRGSCFLHGRDLGGHRVLTLIGRMQTKAEKESTQKLFSFWLERLQRNEPGQHVTFILDNSGASMKEADMGTVRFIVDAFSTYFPDLLERIIILDLPWIMNAIWNVVKLWLSEEQKSRVVFLSRKDLGKYVAPDQLPESLGGESTWKYSFPPFPDDLKQDHDFKNGAKDARESVNA